MILNSTQKERVLSGVEKRLAERQRIDLSAARAIVLNSSLQSKIEEVPMFIAHCGVDQLVDLVVNEVKAANI